MKITKIFLRVILLVVTLAIVSGCIMRTSIENVKNLENVGKTVTISGTVQSTMKIGELSGYIIEDENESIAVSSQSLPEEGTNIRITGKLYKDTLLGYYIKVD